MNHFNMGAINQKTEEYEHAWNATKDNKYNCPSCKMQVILRKGDKLRHHYAHYKSDNPCTYYANPGESDLHKAGKEIMRDLVTRKKRVTITRNCSDCTMKLTFPQSYTNETKAHIEYRFNHYHSTRIADVACLEGGKLLYIYEICNKHKTSPDARPEPWFEIDAGDLSCNAGIQSNSEIINIQCIRGYTCKDCLRIQEANKRKRLEELERKRLEELERKRTDELERKRLEELERNRLEELERKRVEWLERKRTDELERKRLEELEMKRLKQVERKRLKQVERKETEEKAQRIKEEYAESRIKWENEEREIIRENTKRLEEEKIRIEEERMKFLDSFTKEQKDIAYGILDTNIKELKKSIETRIICAKCKKGRCQTCLKSINNEFQIQKQCLPTIDDILKKLGD